MANEPIYTAPPPKGEMKELRPVNILIPTKGKKDAIKAMHESIVFTGGSKMKLVQALVEANMNGAVKL